MNRTIQAALITCCFSLVPGLAQQPGKPAGGAAQADPIEAIVMAIRDAERAAKSVSVELETKGFLPGDLQFSTSGTLDVLRGTQPQLRTSVEFTWANGLVGRMESLRAADDIKIYQDDPAFGPVFVHVPPALVLDLEWAGAILARADLPGMKDGRAEAPLGSGMIDDLRRSFALEISDRRERAGEAGQWLVGKRRPGLGDQDPDLPLADRAEAFVRGRDHAVLEVVHYQGEKVLQRIVAKKLVVDGAIAEAVFHLDGHGQKLREVSDYPPMFEQIERALVQAESKAQEKLDANQPVPPEAKRPSARDKK